MRFFHTLALCLIFLAGCANAKAPVLTPQYKATHLIEYLKSDAADDVAAACTGTAVGPHALLTALHCDYGEYTTITMDYSTRPYHILGFVTDGRDHIIYLLDGPAFKNYIKISPRKPEVGEHVYLYGDGRGSYPPTLKKGVVESKPLSDVDDAATVTYYKLKVIPGDSGSAIYGEDGSILGLTTFSLRHERLLGVEDEMIGFELNFTSAVLDQIGAQNGDFDVHDSGHDQLGKTP